MSVFSVRSTPLVLGLFLVAASSPAVAQVTLNLTTQPPNPVTCVVTTDANGVSLSPDGHTLQATVTNYSGTCGSSTPPPQPPQPPNFALTATASATTGVAFPVSWSVTGAVTCTGSASLSGASVALPGWTDTTTPTSPRSVTASQVGTYTLGLACTNAAGTTNSAPATVVVSQGSGGSCNNPPGLTRQTTGTVTYPAQGGSTTRDFTSFAALWGHYNSHDAEIPWPGYQGTSVIPTIGRNTYIAAAFTVPTNVSSTLSGFIARATYSYGISMTAAYSTTCGDFNPPNAACISVTTGTPLNFPNWATVPSGSQCPLTAGTTYYLNVKATNPSESTATCSASSPTCPMGTIDYFGN